MPIYEYECTHCGERIELLQKISDKPATTCAHCKQESLKKLVSSASFHLKGSGWYATDFRDKKEPPKTDAAEKSEKTEKNDPKPDKKTETKESKKETSE